MKKRYFIPTGITLFTLFFSCIFSFSHNTVQAQDERARELRIKVGATPEESKGGNEVKLWAVVIGVSRYKNGDQTTSAGQIPNLKNAGDDAQGMYDFLRSPNGGNFKDVSEGGHLVLLKDENATKANVERELAKLKQARP